MKTKHILLLILFIASHLLFSQQKWSKTFGENNRYDMTSQIIQTYDGGTLLLSYYYYIVNGKYQKSIWLIKTDVNGNQLWDKVIDFPSSHYIWPTGITETFDQGYVIVGFIVDEFSRTYPIAFKLSKCMAVEWCNLYIDPVTDEPAYFRNVLELSDSTLVVCASNYGDIPQETTMLFKLSLSGKLIWKKAIGSGYTYPVVSLYTSTILKDDSDNLYIAARGYWGSGIVYARPTAIKTDSEGNEIFVTPIGIEENIAGGREDIVLLPGDSLLFYAYVLQSDYIPEWNILLNEIGEVLDYNIQNPTDINENFVSSHTTNAYLCADGKLFSGGYWNYEGLPSWDPPPTLISKISIENLFLDPPVYDTNIINEELYAVGQYHQSTKDSTQILSTYGIPDANGSKINIYFTKYNSDLTESPIDNTPYLYDTACPFGIQSGFIVLDDYTPVSTKETPNPKEYYAHLKTIPIHVFPNPASHLAQIQLENTDHHSNISLQVIDILGKQITQKNIQKSQTETTLDVGSWEKGIYFVVVWSEGEVVGREKFVVR